MAFKRPGVRIPLSPPQKYHTFCMIFFYVGYGILHDFIVVLLCNMNPCGLTLTLLRKRPRHTSYESPCLHHKNIVHLYDIFLCGIGASHDFIVVLLCNMNPCGLTLTLLRKRPRHTSYERSRSFTYKISLMIDDRLFMYHPEKMMFS